MLADAAQVQGGKLFVLGGGFDTISARKLPVIHRSLTVALVAEIEPDERHRDLEISLRLIDEDGIDMGVEAKGKLREARRLHSMTLTSLCLAMNWILNGPVMWRDRAIFRVMVFILLMVSR